jgi:DNA (cytosine-5)-methyltransferase 1
MEERSDLLSYGSVCSGIEAVSLAWRPLGLNPLWFAEVDPFANAVLSHHYPDVPNLGDMTRIAPGVLRGSIEAPAILVGGTPCQSFSVAGMRKGLSDPRGALTIHYVELANAIDKARIKQKKAPAIIVWENVPGVLSDRANAFGCFLGALAGAGCELQPSGPRWTDAGCVYGPQRAIVWRVLDAQHFGVAQRRKRVFLVASARDGFDPSEILFESSGMRRDSAPSREALQEAAAAASKGSQCSCVSQPACSETRHEEMRCITLCFGGGNTSAPLQSAACLTARGHKCDFEVETFAAQALCGAAVSHPLTCAHSAADGNGRGTPVVAASRIRLVAAQAISGAISHTLTSCLGLKEDGTGRGCPVLATAGMRVFAAQGVCGNISHTLNTANNGKGCSEDGTGRGVPVVAVNYRFQGRDITADLKSSTCISFAQNSRDELRLEGGHGHIVGALSAGGGKPGQGYPVVATVSFRGREHNIGAAIGGDLISALRASSHDNANSLVSSGEFEIHLTLMPGSGCDGLLSDLLTWQVRRLMPLECERLQGIPDHYTLVPYRGKPAADGPRYKAIGNSMAVNCVSWIGRRLVRELEDARRVRM